MTELQLKALKELCAAATNGSPCDFGMFSVTVVENGRIRQDTLGSFFLLCYIQDAYLDNGFFCFRRDVKKEWVRCDITGVKDIWINLTIWDGSYEEPDDLEDQYFRTADEDKDFIILADGTYREIDIETITGDNSEEVLSRLLTPSERFL